MPGLGPDTAALLSADPAACGAPVPSLITAECRVVAKAEFPQLQLTDVLCDGKPKQVGQGSRWGRQVQAAYWQHVQVHVQV